MPVEGALVKIVIDSSDRWNIRHAARAMSAFVRDSLKAAGRLETVRFSEAVRESGRSNRYRPAIDRTDTEGALLARRGGMAKIPCRVARPNLDWRTSTLHISIGLT